MHRKYQIQTLFILICYEDLDENDDILDDDEEGEEEMLFNEEPCLDFFSEKVFKSPQECLDYCKTTYGFDIGILKEKHDLDCFSFIRLVNYLRKEKPSVETVMSEKTDKLWMTDDYLKVLFCEIKSYQCFVFHQRIK